jgi:hypothetical protein
MKILIQSIPLVRGFYFVKDKSHTEWQLLVEVIGVAPFLGIASIHCIFKASDDTILGHLLDLDWSEVIDMDAVGLDVHCGYTISRETKQVIVDFLLDGQKLQAFKHLKYSTDAPCMGLKDAKDYCDALYLKLKDSGQIQLKY